MQAKLSHTSAKWDESRWDLYGERERERESLGLRHIKLIAVWDSDWNHKTTEAEEKKDNKVGKLIVWLKSKCWKKFEVGLKQTGQHTNTNPIKAKNKH